MDRDYFQLALHKFNGANWYGWKTHDSDGNKIPQADRMTYAILKLLKKVQLFQVKLTLMQRYKKLKDAEKQQQIKKHLVKLN